MRSARAPQSPPFRSFGLGLLLAAGAAAPLQATYIYKDATTTDLLVAANWATTSGGAVDPATITGSAVSWYFDSNFGGLTGTVGTGTTVGQIRHDGTGNVAITGSTLTLVGNSDYVNAGYGGNEGILMNSGSGGSLSIANNILLGGAQNWVLSRNLSASGNLDLAGYALSVFQLATTSANTNSVIGSASSTITNSGATANLAISAVNSGTPVKTATVTINAAINGGINLSRTGSGILTLANADSTFTGAVSLVGGTTNVAFLANKGSNSSLGSGTGVFLLNGTSLVHTGSSNSSTDRSLQLSGGANSTVSNNGAGTLAFTGDLAFTGSGARGLTLGGSSAAANTFGGLLADGTGGVTTLSKSGSTTWALTNSANSHSGGTNINAGILSVSSTGALGSGTVSIGNAATAATLTYTGTGNTSALVLNLAGTTGGATINQSGTGLLKFTSNLTATGAGAKTLTLGGSTAGTGEISGAIADSASGATSVAKAGTGTWALTGNNTYSGGTAVNAGTLSFGSAAALGSGAVSIGGAATAGSLVYTGSGDTTSLVLRLAGTTGGATISQSGTGLLKFTAAFAAPGVGAKTLTLDGSSLGVGELAGAVADSSSGATALSKNGSGAWTLSAANSYTGGTTVNAGTLNLAHGTNALADTGSVSIVGTGVLGLGANSETIGALSISGGAVTGGGTLTVSSVTAINAGSASIAAALAGSGATLAKSGSGTLTLSGANTYTGATTVNGGVLSVAGSLASGSAVTVNSTGVLHVASGATVAGTVNVADGGTLRGSGSVLGDVTVAAGTGAVTAGDGSSGSLTLSNLTFAGDGVINIGLLGNYTSTAALNVTGNLTLGGAVTVNLAAGALANGTYRLVGHANTLADIASMTVSGATISTRQRVSLENNAGYIEYVVSGDSPVWTGANGGAISGGANWKLIVAGTPTDYQPADILLFDDTATGTTNVDVSSDIAPANVTFANSSRDYVLSGASGITSGTFVKSGSGSVTISNANAFAASTISAGTVTLGAAAALGTASGIALDGGTLNLNGQSVGNAISLGGGELAGNGSVAGVISGAGSIAKSTSGTLTLSGRNTYTGGTTVSAGVLALGHATDTLADTGAVTVSGGELSLGANADTIGALSISGGSISGSGTLTVASVAASNAAASSISAAIAGVGATLGKTGGGTLTLSGQNTYTGLTTVSNGTLALGHATNTLADTAAVTVAGGTLDAGANSDTFGALAVSSGAITGSGTLTVASLTATNNGSVTVSTALGSSGTLAKSGSGTLTLDRASSFATLALSAGSINASGGLAVTSSISATNDGAATLSGSISGAGATLTKTGAGTLTLAGSNSFTGLATVSAGTLALGHATNTLADAASVTVSGTGTLDLGANSDTVNAVILSGTGAITGTGTFTVASLTATNSGAASIFANIGGTTSTSSLIYNGTGTLTFGGVGSYQGSTRIDTLNGVLRLTGNAVLGGTAGQTGDNGNIWFTGNQAGGVLEFETATNLGVASQIRFRNTTGGSAGVGTGGILRYVGTTAQTVSKTIFSDTSYGIRLESSSVGGSVDFSGSWSSSARPVFLGGAGAGDNKVSGVLSATNLTKRDSGKWVLSNVANTYTGVTTISGGTLAVAKLANGGVNSSLGSSANAAASLVFGGGTLSYVGSGDSTDRAFTVSSAGLQLTNDGTGALSWSGAATVFVSPNIAYTFRLGGANASANNFGTVIANNGTGAISLVKQDAGTWALSGNNSYTGSTTLSAGTLQAGSDTAFGTGALLLNGGALSSNGATARTLGNAITLGGDVTLGNATANGALTFGGDVALGGARTLTVASAVTLGGVVSGGGLTKAGNGTLTLSGAGTYTGGTTVNAGTLALGAAERLGDTGAVTVNSGGTLSLGGFAETVSSLTLSGGTVSDGTLTASSLELRSGTLSAALAGNGTLTKSTSGVATLAGASSFGGATAVDAGTLAVSGSLSGSAVTVGGNAILSVTGSLSGSAVSVLSDATLRGTGNAGDVTLAAGAVVQAGLAGAGSLSMDSLTIGDGVAAGLGIADIAGYGSAAAYSIGTVTLGSGASIVLNLSGSYSAGTYNLLAYTGSNLSSANVTVSAAGKSTRLEETIGFGTPGVVSYTLTGSKVYWVGSAAQWSAAGNWSMVSDGIPTATSFIDLDDLVFDDNATGATIEVDADVAPTSLSFEAGVKSFTINGTKGILGGAFSKTGAGSVTINNANAFASSTIAGGTVILGASAALGAAPVALNGGNLDLGGQSIANAIVLGGGSLVGAGTVSGVISGSGVLAKSTAGTLTLAGSNIFTGGTTVSAGVLALGNATDTLADAGAVSVSGGELALGANSDTVGALSISGGSISGSGTLTVASVTATNEGDATVSANLAGSGAPLSKSGAGTLSLTGVASYTGLTSVSNGTLSFGSGAHTVGGLAISGGTVAGDGTLTVSSVSATNAGSAAISAKVAGSGALSKSGAGTLSLSGANTYTGGTTVTNGVLSFANGSLGSSGNVSVNGGTLRWASGNTQDISSRLVLSNTGAATLDTNGNDVSLAGAIGGATSSTLTKAGNGKLTLAAAATYTGATTVSAGTLQIGAGGAAGSIGGSAASLVTVASGATLAFNRTGTLDYKTTARMRNVTGDGDIVLDGGLKFFNYTGSGTGFAEAGSWSGFSGRLVVLGGSEFQTIRNGRTAMGTAQIVLGDAGTSGILSQIEGNWTWTNGIQLVGADNIIRNNATGSGRWLKLQGALTGSGNLTIADPAAAVTSSDSGVILTGTNTLDGQLTIDTFVRVGGVGGDSSALGAGSTGDLGSASVVINTGKRLTFSRSDAASFANAISGAGSVRIGSSGITGSATQDITLSGSNAYSGGTEVLQGTLRIGSLANIASGALTVRGGSGFVYTGTGSETATASLALDNGAATLGVSDANAVLTWNDAATKGGASGGLITKTGDGTLVLGGAITAGGATAVRVAGGTLGLSGVSTYLGATTVDAGATLDVSGGLAAGTAITLGGALRISGASDQALSGGIAGGGSLLKTGAGLLTLASDNSGFTGSISVGAGTLLLGHLSGLGGSKVSVGNGATLDLASYGVANDLSISGGTLLNYENWTGGLVIDTAGAGAAEAEALLTLYARSSITVLAGGSLAVGGMTKAVVVDGGSLLGDLSAYTGELTVRSAVSFASSSAGGKVVLDGGSVDFGDRSASDEIHYRGGSLTAAGSFSGDLVVDAPSVNLAAGTLGGARVVVGVGSAVSIGTGLTNEIRLSGGSLLGDTLNNLGGTLTVAAGLTFDLDGADDTLVIANSSADIALESGAKLKGTGAVGDVTLQSGASLSPGNSPGLITAQSLVLGAGSYEFEVARLTNFFGDGPAAAGTDYDSVTVVGELDLSSLSVSSRLVLNLISLGEDGLVGTPSGWDLGSPFELRLFGYGSLDMGSNSDIGALFLVNTSQFLSADQTPVDAQCFTIINDEVNYEIRLAYSAIPEPSTYGMALGGLALAAAAYRRRRQKSKA